MMSTEEMCRVVTGEVKNLHLELVRKWGFPAGLLAGATFGLVITMMRECGSSEKQIVEVVRRIVGELSAAPDARGSLVSAGVECPGCRAGLPIVWHRQSRRNMHLGPGLSVESCAVIDARERRARDIANDRGNEDQRGR